MKDAQYERYRSHYYSPGTDNTDPLTTRDLVLMIDTTNLNDRVATKKLRELCKNNPYGKCYLLVKETDNNADNDFKKNGRYV